jgi:hypothetical protein
MFPSKTGAARCYCNTRGPASMYTLHARTTGRGVSGFRHHQFIPDLGFLFAVCMFHIKQRRSD